MILCPVCDLNRTLNDEIFEIFHTLVDENMLSTRHYICSEGHFFQQVKDVFGNLIETTYHKPISINE